MIRMGRSGMGRRRATLKVSAAAAAAVLASLGTISTGATSAAAQTGSRLRPGAASVQGAAQAACTTKCLAYQGGPVFTGHEKVYLVFWGSQWGSQGTNSAGNATFTGDPVSLAPYLQSFIEGLGTAGDTWSGIMTVYCQGVAVAAYTCPSSSAHVAYPTGGGVLAGVWEDNAALEPLTASGHQLAKEAEKAATHFGNTTAALNANTQYVIVSATGRNPDNYKTSGFCAWHDVTNDSSLDGGGAATGPALPFTNLPYVPNVGTSCGSGVVNAADVLDGVSIIEGHEYAETITDPLLNGKFAWISASQQEIGDLCAWKLSGTGRLQDVTWATGTFAVQGMWSNTANSGAGGCVISHAIVT